MNFNPKHCEYDKEERLPFKLNRDCESSLLSMVDEDDEITDQKSIKLVGIHKRRMLNGTLAPIAS